MVRLINKATKVVVNVDERVAELLGTSYRSLDGASRGGKSDAKPAGNSEAKEKSATPDDSWKVAELKDYAKDKSIDLGKSTSKPDILAAIAAATQTAAAQSEDSAGSDSGEAADGASGAVDATGE